MIRVIIMEENRKYLFEKEKVLKAIIKLALPSVMGQIILVLYNMADTLFIGMTKSDVMITAITVCTPAFMFLSAISNLFGVGAASVIARALGRNETEKAKLTSSFAIWGCIFVTAIYTLCAYIFCDQFIDILGGTNPSVHSQAEMYMKCAIVAGGLVTALNTLMSHLLRAYGCSVHASAGIVIGGVLNIILDPIFMFVILPSGKEVFGAALATALSNLCALLYYIYIFRMNRMNLSISAVPTKEMLSGSIPRDVLKVGVAAFLMTLFENISYAVLDKLMSYTGTSAQAGIGVAKKVNMLAHCFVRGMTQGVLPLIAYNYSSGSRKRMKKIVYTSAAVSVGIAMMCTLSCLVFSKPLISIFIHVEGESLHYGTQFLRILCVGAPFSAFAYSVISFFQATGRGGRSTLLAMLRKGILDIPLMYIMFSLIPAYGIVAATPIADVICSIIATILFMSFIRSHGHDKNLDSVILDNAISC